MVKIRSSIRTEMKKKVLFRGTALSVLGACLLLYGGFEGANLWQWALGVGLIALGMIPYRRLTLLEDMPDRLVIEGNELHFLRRGKLKWHRPLSKIQNMHYRERGELYGIVVDDEFFPFFSYRSYEKLKNVMFYE